MSIKELVKEINRITDDDQLKEISTMLNHSISAMTSKNSPDKYEHGKKTYLDIEKKYIQRLEEILKEKFSEALNK